MIELEVIDAEKDHFMVRGDEPYRVEIIASDPMIAHVYRGEEIDEHQEPVGAYDGTIPAEHLTGWKVEDQPPSLNYAQIQDALEEAAEEAKSDWIDRDIISRAQDKLGEWLGGYTLSESFLDRFAIQELGWEPSEYPADAEWRGQIGTADIAYN